MFYLVQKLGPAPTMFFFWSLLSLYRHFTVKSENPIPINDREIILIACVFTEIVSVGAVLWGVENMSDYTWIIHHVCVAVASIASCIFLFFIWSNKQRFIMRYGAKRKIGLATSCAILLSFIVPFDLVTSSFFPAQPDYVPHSVLPYRILESAIGNIDSSIGLGSVLCWIDAMFILRMFAVLLEAKSRKQTQAGDPR